MAVYVASNNADSTLAGSLTNVATSLTTATGEGARFPAVAAGDWTYLTLEDASNNIEIIKCEGHVAGTDSFTSLTRGQRGTTARAWSAGDVVSLRPLAEEFVEAYNHVADTSAAHAATAITVTPAGTIAATTVQAAIQELDGDIQTKLTTSATAASGSADIVLTAASERVQSINMTAADKSVTLPDPATLQEGGPIFTLYKTGGYGFDIKSNSGAAVGRINSSKMAFCYLIDAATDSWRVGYADLGFAVGAAATFNAATTNSPQVCAIDANNALVVYDDGGDGNKLKAKVLTVSGTTVTASAATTIDAASSGSVDVKLLSSTAALVSYAKGSDAYAVVVTLSGATITGAGTPLLTIASPTTGVKIAVLSSTLAVMFYGTTTSGNGTARCLSISGTTITMPGAAATFNAANTGTVACATLDSTHVVVAYSDAGNSNYGTACCLSVSGTTLTAGAEAVFQSTNATSSISVSAASASLAFVTYGGTGLYSLCKPLAVSGTTVTPGALITLDPAITLSATASVYSGGRVAVLLRDGSTFYPRVILYDVLGSTLSEAIPIDYAKKGSVTNFVICALSADKVLLVCRDNDASNVGIAIAVGL